jgi:thioredoxin-dependent peroxiredoxin
MTRFVDSTLTVMFVVTALATSVLIIGATPAIAVEVGQPAPAFKLPATTGTDIALSDYRGKKWVLLEFYGADFAPT